MQIRELSQPMTSKLLNESLGKKFGYRLKLENFTDGQLEDARNKLRTRLSQFEVNESFDSVLENTEYQKTRMFLDVINQAILEREMTSAEKGKEEKIKKKVDPSGMKKSMKKQYGKEKGKNVYFATIRKKAMSERADDLAVPESWIESALKRIDLGESDHTELKAELKLRYDLNESQASWLLLEGEEEKAEIILATKDMIDRITGWLDDLANLKAEQLLELLDSIRAEMGSDVAEQYSQQVKPALDGIYSAIETSRQGLGQGLALISGGQAPTMGGTPTGGAPAGGEIGGLNMPEPTTGGIENELPPTGGEEELPPVATDVGREKRESIDYSRRLSMLLNSKKK